MNKLHVVTFDEDDLMYFYKDTPIDKIHSIMLRGKNNIEILKKCDVALIYKDGQIRVIKNRFPTIKQ